MHTVQIEIKLYNIEELDAAGKKFAVNEHRNFLVDTYQDSDFDESFNMTRSKYVRQLTNADTIEDIIANEYLFFEDGKLAKTVSYCGGHPRAGQHIFEYEGKEYPLEGRL